MRQRTLVDPGGGRRFSLAERDAHTTKLIRDRLAKRPRWHVHATPTCSSWFDQVERIFAMLADRGIRRGVHRSVAALKTDIEGFIDRHNADPTPFRCTKSASDILASVERLRLRTPPTPPLEMQRVPGSGHYCATSCDPAWKKGSVVHCVLALRFWRKPGPETVQRCPALIRVRCCRPA